MRTLGKIFIFMGTVLFLAANSHAAFFDDSIYFPTYLSDSDAVTEKGREAVLVIGAGSYYDLSFEHNVTFIPPAAQINSASLTFSHYGNSGSDRGELWLINSSGVTPKLIGKLSDSHSVWLDETFVIPAELYADFSGSLWTLALNLNETSMGTDKLWIEQSTLSGDYTPVPLPASLWLFGSGLAACGALRTRKEKRYKSSPKTKTPGQPARGF